MKLKFLYIFAFTIALVSCQTEALKPSQGTGTLSLGMTRAGTTSSQAIDDDLALKVLDSEGNVYVEFRAGNVPRKVVLEPGTFTVIAYTENQDTWTEANEGLGEACYYGTSEVSIEFDQTCYVNMEVPMVNYAVTVTMPDLFDNLFKDYAFNLVSGDKSVSIREGQKAYFTLEDGGFEYKLTATNTDNVTHSSSPLTYSKVEHGKLYNITYYYGTDANSGGIDIEITDNMETEDDYVPLSD